MPESSEVPALSLRPMVSEDLVAVAALEALSIPTPWSAESFAAELAKEHALSWVLTDDETDEVIWGYLVAHQLGPELHLLTLAVLPRGRRLGLGRRLLQDLVRQGMASGAQRLVLEVRRSNEAALGLYQAAGFSILRVMRGYYSDGEDAYALCLALDESQLSDEEKSF